MTAGASKEIEAFVAAVAARNRSCALSRCERVAGRRAPAFMQSLCTSPCSCWGVDRRVSETALGSVAFRNGQSKQTLGLHLTRVEVATPPLAARVVGWAPTGPWRVRDGPNGRATRDGRRSAADLAEPPDVQRRHEPRSAGTLADRD